MHHKTPSVSSAPSPEAPKETTSTTQPAGLRVFSVFFRIALILVILGATAGVVKILMATKEQPARSSETFAPIRVRTIIADLYSVDRTWDGYGTARSMNDANVVAEVAGRVIERPSEIEPGQKINVGTVLMRLDSSDYTNALNAANQAASAIEAQLNGLSVESERVGTQIRFADDEIEAAQNDLDRTKHAIEAGAGSAGELDVKTASLRRVQREVESLKEKLELIPSRRAQLLAQLAGQRANASTAQENLSRSVIRSPIAGVLQSVNARRGDWVGLGSAVARVVDLSQIEIPVRFPASSMNWISLGHQVQLWAGDPTGEPDQVGIITRIAPESDASSRTITVFVELEQDPESANRLSPGRFILGRVRSPDDNKRFVIPRRAIHSGRVMIAVPQEEGGFRIDVRPVTIDYSIDGLMESLDAKEDQWTVIDSGLNIGDRVVISLLDQISQGLMVEVVGIDTPTAVEQTRTNQNTQQEAQP